VKQVACIVVSILLVLVMQRKGSADSAGFGAEYGASGFGATVQVSGSDTGPSAGGGFALSSAPDGYAGATVLSDTFGSEAVWLAAGSTPGSQVGCSGGQGVLASASSAPVGSTLYVLVNQQGVPIGTDTVSCAPGPVGRGVQPPPPPPTGRQVWAAEASTWQQLIHGGIEANPGGVGLTGLASWFWLTNGAARLTAPPISIDGYTVTASVSATSYSWTFGDGAVQSSAGVGSAAEPAVAHTYQTLGNYSVTCEAHYVGTFTFAGFGIAPQTQPFAIDAAEANLTYPVQEVRGVVLAPGIQP
jgi:hypothetical protein